VPIASDAARRLEAFMKASWSVMEKAAYVRGHLFHEDDQYPDSLDKAFAMLVDIHGRDDWEPGASRLLDPTELNVEVILAEKGKAVAEVARLLDTLSPRTLGIPDDMARDFETMLELYALWVRGFEHCARTVFLARKAERSSKVVDAAAALETLPPLRAFCAEIDAHLRGTHHPHIVYWLLDERRLLMLADDVERRLTTVPATT
jgi:hypothetical protein